MQLGDSMLHSWEISNNPCHIRIWSFRIHFNIAFTCMPRPYRGLFTIDLHVKILKSLLPSPFLATCFGHLNFVELITLIILGKKYELWSNYFQAFSTPNFHPVRAQIFTQDSVLKYLNHVYELRIKQEKL